MKILLLFICSAFTSYCYPQAKVYSPKVRLAIETYAFLKGQNVALDMIAAQFPVLKHDVAKALKNSNVFGQAERNIERFLENELDDSEFKILRAYISSLLSEQLKNPIEKEKYARDFLEQVNYRSRFNTDLLISKSILSFAYDDAPHQEITDGHIITFNTKGHPKAKEVHVKLPIPKSWKAEEAEMSQTIKQFTSYDGKGNEKFLIVVHDLTEEDQNLVLDEKSILEMIPPEARLIRSEAVIIDGNPGMMIEIEENLNSEHEKMKIRMLQFMFAQNQKLYCFQGSIGPVKVTENLDFQLKKYEPLFRLVASGARVDH